MAFAASILILVLILYACKIGSFYYAWKKHPEFVPASESPEIKVSVVVPFRNEKDTIVNLLNHLVSQSYPSGLFEVILVDDHSEDGSGSIVREFCREHEGFIYAGSKGTGKKNALQQGIRQSVNNLIVLTDADCEMDTGWLATICAFRKQMQPDMILGITDLFPQSAGLFSYQQTEFVSLIASGAAAAAQGKPVYCNGANLAFTRDVFENLNNPLNSKIVSGDDTFLLHNAKNEGRKILVLKASAAVVRTAACKSVNEYFAQRIRWASKARYFKDRDTIMLALLVALTNLSLITGLIFLLTGRLPWLLPLLF